jgi:predicted kinase
MAHDVFVSHSAKDKPTADAVCAVLESQGIRCWVAPRDIIPGKDWGESIVEAIKGARVMVLVFSTNANNSQQIKREVERAVNKGIPIIPLRIEDVVPTASLEYFLSTPHWLDAFTPPLEKHLQFLAQIIRQIVGGPAAEVLTAQAPAHESADKAPAPVAAKPESPVSPGQPAAAPAPDKGKTAKMIWIAAGTLAVLFATLILTLSGWFGPKPPPPRQPQPPPKTVPANDPEAIRQAQFERLKTFFAAKEHQAQFLAAKDGKTLIPEVQSYFAAGKQGDWKTVDSLWTNFFRRRGYLYEHTKDSVDDDRLKTPYWHTLIETWGAWADIDQTAPKYTQIMTDEIIRSIPPGSIYLGGSDPGRFNISAMCPSQPEGDPFFTITQNAVADPVYLEYVRLMYGAKIQLPTKETAKKVMNDFYTAAQQRYQHDLDFPNEPPQIKPGEFVGMESGKFTISGAVAVMAINASIIKIIFDNNPDREFYIEESYPLAWTFPYLEPHGLIMKINRRTLPELNEQMVDADRKYWRNLADRMIGDWLTEETTVKAVAEFANKVYVRKDLAGFTGDPGFVQNDSAMKMFSHMRLAIAGLYAWRIGELGGETVVEDYTAKSPQERQRMAAAADFAFRQAFALCPSSQEAVYRYANFLTAQNRAGDAILMAQAASEMPSLNEKDTNFFGALVKSLKAISGK